MKTRDRPNLGTVSLNLALLELTYAYQSGAK